MLDITQYITTTKLMQQYCGNICDKFNALFQYIPHNLS